MKKYIEYLIAVAALISTISYSQNEAKIWYFGNQAGLDFNTSPPTILTNGLLNSTESQASIADANGNLLFYTDGITIWDKTHSIMFNGAGLNGAQSTTQGALIVKQPGSLTRYFVFTLDAEGYPNGLQYSIVDISLSSGNGVVIVKNVLLYAPSTEKLTATLHSNAVDVWIITHDYNSNNFKCYLLTSAGVSSSPVISSIGPIHDGTFACTHGYMKVSPDKKKIGLTIQGLNTCELYDFDCNTGLISNQLVLSNTVTGAYGCEFSPDGRKFYANGLGDTILHQWDLCAGTNSGIIQSIVSIHSSPFYIAGMQLASDGKIYVARYLQQTLGVINFPNNKGVTCNYSEFGQSISPGVCIGGLPNQINYKFWIGPTLSVTSTDNFSSCSGETKTLSANGAASYTWNTGLISPTIVISPSVTTTYTVKGSVNTGCIFEESVSINVSPCTDIFESEKLLHSEIYPIPTADFLQINVTSMNLFPLDGKLNYKITDLYSHVVLHDDLKRENGKGEIDIRSLKEGVYYLFLLEKGNVVLRNKIIVAK